MRWKEPIVEVISSDKSEVLSVFPLTTSSESAFKAMDEAMVFQFSPVARQDPKSIAKL